MSEESIIKKVASAIWKQRVETAAKNGVDLSKDDEEFMISANSIVDEARAAIQAYEAAKREAAEPYVTRVEKGVTYWSNGFCSQSIPGSKEFAEAQLRALQEASKTIPDLMKGLNPFDEERMSPRENKLNWERPE